MTTSAFVVVRKTVYGKTQRIEGLIGGGRPHEDGEAWSQNISLRYGDLWSCVTGTGYFPCRHSLCSDHSQPSSAQPQPHTLSSIVSYLLAEGDLDCSEIKTPPTSLLSLDQMKLPRLEPRERQTVKIKSHIMSESVKGAETGAVVERFANGPLNLDLCQ